MPADWEAEAKELRFWDQPGKFSDSAKGFGDAAQFEGLALILVMREAGGGAGGEGGREGERERGMKPNI